MPAFGYPLSEAIYWPANWDFVQYQVLIEFDPETKAYSASVPGLAVFVSADSEKEALKLVKEGLQLYLEETRGRRRPPHAERPAKAKLVTVEI